MYQLTNLRKELDFNKQLSGIINVLKEVASAEFYRLQTERKKFDEFADYLREFLQIVNARGVEHIFLQTTPLPQALLLITSDTGFLGKLNLSIVNSAVEQCTEDDKLIVVGRQGARYLEEMGKNFVFFPGITDAVKFKEIEAVGKYILRGSLGSAFGKTTVVYPHFVSFALWQIQSYQLLPCKFLFQEWPKEDWEEKVILESTLNKIIESLVKTWIVFILQGIFWESKLSEWSARVIHLEESSTKINQANKKLQFRYFSLLHQISDKNIREILASRLAVSRTR